MTSYCGLHVLTQRMLYLVMTVTSVMARSVSTPTDGSSSSSPVQPSHLLFYLTVEKQLIPQTSDLADRALHILQTQCQHSQKKTSTCMAEAEKLPAIAVLGGFPSSKALQKEKSKVFTKHLLKEAYISLHKLHRLLETENDEGFQFLTDLITLMNKTCQQLKTEVEALYGVAIPDKKYAGVEKSKKRYTRLSRLTTGNCRPQHVKGSCRSEGEYRLRLLYTTYERLLRVNHVLDYVVRLSWLAVEKSTWS